MESRAAIISSGTRFPPPPPHSSRWTFPFWLLEILIKLNQANEERVCQACSFGEGVHVSAREGLAVEA